MGRAIERVIANEPERVVAGICHQLQQSHTALISESLDNRRRRCAHELRGDDTCAGACCTGADSLSLEYDGAQARDGGMQGYGQTRDTSANNGNIDF